MFYQGDLQSGISTAVQESKLVACFITDDGDESQLWENEFLKHEDIQPLLLDKAVLLRLQAGSQEAGHLAAIFPLPKTPTLVVLSNGELKEYLVSGATREDFVRRLLITLGGSPNQTSQSSSTSTIPPVSQSSSSRLSSIQTSNSTSQSASPAPQSAAMQAMLAERRAKLDDHKRKQEAEEKAKLTAAANARKEVLDAAAEPGSRASADKKYAIMQKKRQQDARDERARILKRVEDDKAERRHREAERKAQATVAKEAQVQTPTAMASTSKRASSECALQVRLFDGSTIRSRFPAQGSLTADVRPWIDEKQEGDTPYTFKQVLTPLPNRNIGAGEEEQSLQSLGLTPNATLILLPVNEYTSAYQPQGIIGTGFGLVSSGFGAVSGMLGNVLGTGRASSPAPSQQEGSSSSGGPSAHANKVRTLRDQEDKKDVKQFYNGNALNFEPRQDDIDDQKKQD